MSTLHVQNVPNNLYERLRKQARCYNRSLSPEVIALLNEAMSRDASTQAELLANIRRRRSFRPAEQGASSSTVLLREDREL